MPASADAPAKLRLLPEPRPVQLSDSESYGILITGIGGTGVVTISALLTTAAHLEGKAYSTIDQFGMAQKGGAVTSHVRIARHQSSIQSARLSSGGANLILGCDSLVSAGELALNVIDPGYTRVLVNNHQAITGQFALDPSLTFPSDDVEMRITAEAGEDKTKFLNATRLATSLLGDAIGSNLFMLGHAYQQGLIPVSAEALEKAIEINGVAVNMNKSAFLWGRRAAIDLEAVEAHANPNRQAEPEDDDLQALVDRRKLDLTAYQNGRLAQRFTTLVNEVEAKEQSVAPGHRDLAIAVARNLFKLMAYKDEYEVARLYSDGRFQEMLKQQFEGDYTLTFHLAPPILSKQNTETGMPIKRDFGPWMTVVLGWVARLRFLRGSPFDIFGRTEERKMERRLIMEYEDMVGEILSGLNADNRSLAIRLATLPEMITGYGHVKAQHYQDALILRDRLLAEWRNPSSSLPEAAE